MVEFAVWSYTTAVRSLVERGGLSVGQIANLSLVALIVGQIASTSRELTRLSTSASRPGRGFFAKADLLYLGDS